MTNEQKIAEFNVHLESFADFDVFNTSLLIGIIYVGVFVIGKN